MERKIEEIMFASKLGANIAVCYGGCARGSHLLLENLSRINLCNCLELRGYNVVAKFRLISSAVLELLCSFISHDDMLISGFPLISWPQLLSSLVK